MSHEQFIANTRPLMESFDDALKTFKGQSLPLEALALLLQNVVDDILAHLFEVTPDDPPPPDAPYVSN